MRKLLCCVLAALLAVLPCCGVAEGSFYELNKEEAEYIVASLEAALSSSAHGLLCEVKFDGSYDGFMSYFMDLTTEEDTYRAGVTLYGTHGKKGIEQIFIDLDFDSRVLMDDGYITELLMVPCWGLAYLDAKMGTNIMDAEIDNAWDVLMGYVEFKDMNRYYYYEHDQQHWIGLQFFQPSNESDPYTGAIYCHVNIK